MPRYRIEHSRYDVLPERYDFNASSDDEARQYFEQNYVNNPAYVWDHLNFWRIDVVEQTTLLDSNDPRKRSRT